jgi:hypothetical protein
VAIFSYGRCSLVPEGWRCLHFSENGFAANFSSLHDATVSDKQILLGPDPGESAVTRHQAQSQQILRKTGHEKNQYSGLLNLISRSKCSMLRPLNEKHLESYPESAVSQSPFRLHYGGRAVLLPPVPSPHYSLALALVVSTALHYPTECRTV